MDVQGTDPAAVAHGDRAARLRSALVVCGLTAGLFLLLFLNRWLFKSHPFVWPVIPLALCAALWGATFGKAGEADVALWRLIGLTAAVVALVRYPLMPVSAEIPHAMEAYLLMLAAWVVAVVAGLACFRRPSLAILPPAYLVWSKSFAVAVTGLPNWMVLDVMPLLEASICLGAGLALTRVMRAASARRLEPSLDDFARALPLFAIAVHLANYFWSAVAKLQLQGPPLAWLQNTPANIFLSALHDHHVAFAGYPAAVDAVYRGLDGGREVSSVFVLGVQAAAIVGLFLPRRGLIVLLLGFDVLHLGIVVAAGANFWQWIALNVVIAVVVARRDPTRAPALHKALATLLIACAPWLVATARLGWFDSGANNRIYIEAIDRAGRSYPVSSNFFTFYSYPIAHMDYGAPGRDTALSTGTPNGGVQSFSQLQAAQRCDVEAIQKEGWGPRPLDPRLLTFLADYHRLAIAAQDALGGIPANLYPHHFYAPPGYGAAFDELDKRQVAAYVVKRESACLTYDGGLRRDVLSEAEERIDLP